MSFDNESAVAKLQLSVSEMVQVAVDAADSKGGEDFVALDVSEPMPLVDAFLLVSARNERQVAAIADEIEDELLERGVKRIRREGRQEARWVLLDFGDLIVHVFHEQERVFYDLERLWKDCPTIDFELNVPQAVDLEAS